MNITMHLQMGEFVIKESYLLDFLALLRIYNFFRVFRSRKVETFLLHLDSNGMRKKIKMERRLEGSYRN